MSQAHNDPGLRKQFIDVPLPLECGLLRKVCHKLVGILLLPGYLLAAGFLRAPGISVYIKLAFLALRLFFLRRISLRTCSSLMFYAMDSTRYFEFFEVLNAVVPGSFHRYLDISSPRVIPLMLLAQNKSAVAQIINPDQCDLEDVGCLLGTLKLKERCTLTSRTINDASCFAGSFDLITCISVLEHIPEDKEAVAKIWSLLAPGGRLILTLPCMVCPVEQYTSRDEYGVLPPGADGYTFLQRFYDEKRLEDIIFSIIGKPAKMIIYGERKPGYFYRNASVKRLWGALYPFWKEAYIMAKEYRYFKTLSALPGEGVVMLEFVKP